MKSGIISLFILSLLLAGHVSAQHPTIVWNRSPEEDVSRYRVYRGHRMNALAPVVWEATSAAVAVDTEWTDAEIRVDKDSHWRVYYRVTALDNAGNESHYSRAASVSGDVSQLSVEALLPALQLFRNYPNPFNAGTTIHFRLTEAASVAITVYNVRGELIRRLFNETLSEGDHRMKWDGRNQVGRMVASGIYVYRVEAKMLGTADGRYETSSQMLLLR